jgi:hypothetical protein
VISDTFGDWINPRKTRSRYKGGLKKPRDVGEKARMRKVVCITLHPISIKKIKNAKSTIAILE